MTFIVTLIALLIERFFDWSHLRHWYWYEAYQRLIMKYAVNVNPTLILAVMMVPILLLILLLQLLLQNLLYGLIEFVFQLFILLYCLGPRNLWADIFASIQVATDNPEINTDKLKILFSIDTKQKDFPQQYLIQHFFLEAHRRVFATIFWFIVLGPMGALLYRMISLSASFTNNVSSQSKLVESVLDWIPIRLFTCLLALGGHFVKMFSCWTKKVFLGLEHNESLLMECGTAALGSDELEKASTDGTMEKHAVHLIDRAFVIMLLILLMISLIS